MMDNLLAPKIFKSIIPYAIALGFIQRHFPHPEALGHVFLIDAAPRDLSHINTFVLRVYAIMPFIIDIQLLKYYCLY